MVERGQLGLKTGRGFFDWSGQDQEQVLRAQNEALDNDNTFYRSELGRRYRIVSVSSKIQELLHQVEQIASIPRPVLIRGERGTGK